MKIILAIIISVVVVALALIVSFTKDDDSNDEIETISSNSQIDNQL